MEAVMRGRRAAGLPWRRGDQQEATSATLAGQERAARAFERTARRRRLRAAGAPKKSNHIFRLSRSRPCSLQSVRPQFRGW